MNVTFMIKIILILLAAFLIYVPELLPRCAHCGRIKPRSRFLFHICISMRLSRKGNLSLCKKCCKKEGFTSVARFKQQADARKKAEENMWWQL